MKNKNTNIKETIIITLILLCGAAFTATSFCVYYLVKPRIPAVLAVICICDLFYSIFCTCAFFKYMDMGTSKWLLKGVLLSVGYTVAFIVIAVAFLVFTINIDFLKNNILGIVFYAFFTGPSIFIVLAIGALLLIGASGGF